MAAGVIGISRNVQYCACRKDWCQIPRFLGFLLRSPPTHCEHIAEPPRISNCLREGMKRVRCICGHLFTLLSLKCERKISSMSYAGNLEVTPVSQLELNDCPLGDLIEATKP
jgi:hypothetical protein